MTFYVGQKVVCIDDYSDEARRWGVNCPSFKQVYTIRCFEDRGTEPSLRLVEIVNGLKKHQGVLYLVEPSFSLLSFRPIVERKTSIEIFTRMLTDQQVDA